MSTSVPSNNRINGKETIVFARRLLDTHSNFAGIVFASVNTSISRTPIAPSNRCTACCSR